MSDLRQGLAFLIGGGVGAALGLFLGAIAVNVVGDDIHFAGHRGYEATGLMGMVLGFIGMGALWAHLVRPKRRD